MLINKFETILFDFDGTLVRIEADWSYARKQLYQKILKDYNFDFYSGFSLMLDCALSMGWSEIKEVGSEILRKIEGAAKIIPLVENINIVKSLKDKSLGIVTNNLRTTAEQAIKNLDLKMFKIIIGYEDVNKLKPDPDPIELALFKLNADKSTSVFIGDKETDRAAAYAANIQFYFIKELYEKYEKCKS